MNLFRRLSFCCLFLSPGVLALGQQDHPHTLLWRISGRGLNAPSYLFGTLHLMDKRVFQFGDSVYKAIEKTTGLAIEVNPDELAAYIVNKLFNESSTDKMLKDVLNKEYFERKSKALAKKFHKPADKITTAEVVKEKNKWLSDLMQKGEMPTFVDAYLYNMARRQGKWLGGVEDLSDQTGLLEGLIDASDINDLLASDSIQGQTEKNSTEQLIDLYLRQDVDGIEAFTRAASTAEEMDKLLIRRNMKMARRIDSLASLRTMFIAIGAAHLGGDSGVIRLLQKRGFTLTPVISGKKIDVKDYRFAEIRIPWAHVDDPMGMYKVDMPANPADVNLYSLLKMKFLLDLFNMAGYCTMASVSPNDLSKKDSLFNAIGIHMFNEKHPAYKRIANNGVEGREYINRVDGSNVRIQIFMDRKATYLAMVSALKKETLSTGDADKFFASFAITPPPARTGAVHVFRDPIMGVSLSTPSEMEYNTKLSNMEDGWKSTGFAGADIENSFYFMLISKDTRPGFHITSDSLIYDQMVDQFTNQYNGLKKEEITLQGQTGIALTGQNKEQPNLYLHLVCFVRHNRYIALFTVSDKERLQAPVLKNIFGSLSFIDAPRPDWRSYSAPGGSISAWAPSPFRHYDVNLNKEQVLAYDTTTATSFFVMPDTLNKYTYFQSEDIFWEQEVKADHGEDSITEEKPIVNGDLKGREFFVRKSRDGSTFNRVRLILDGDKIYKLFVSGEREFLKSADVDKFFGSFRLNGAAAPDFVTRPKIANLLADLAAEDSLTRSTAYNAFFDYDLQTRDLPLLQQALFKDYRSPNDTTVSEIINNTLSRKIALFQDSTTLPFLQRSMSRFSGGKRGRMRNIVFSTLAQIRTSESYSALAADLQRYPPEESMGYTFFGSLQDSLGLTAAIYPSLIRLAGDTILAPTLADIGLVLLDTGYIKEASIRPLAGLFIRSAIQLLPALKRRETGNPHISALVTLLGRLKVAPAFAVLKDYLSVKDVSLAREAALQLLKGDQQVPSSTWDRIAADPSTRTDLYSELKKMNKAALFPAAWHTQAAFAESAVYDAASDTDEDPDSVRVRFLVKKSARFRKKQYSFYLYKVSLFSADGVSERLGIAGGYDPGSNTLRPLKDITGVFWDQAFADGDLQTLLHAYLKQQEEGPETKEE